jgi:GLPGLI family protein
MINVLKIMAFACLILSVPIGVFAQKNVILEPAIIECRYIDRSIKDTLTGEIEADTMILRIGRNISCFYSKDVLFSDSLKLTPNGFQKWMRLLTQYIKEGRRLDLLGNDSDYYYLNYPEQGQISVRTTVSSKGVEYSEERETIQWEFRDSVKTVLGFECYLAEADFRGRRWSAWYTLEVPVSQGPWKLWGLPGLICEAYEDQGQYSYSLVSFIPDPGVDVVLYNLFKSYDIKTRFEIYEAIERSRELMKESARQSGTSHMLGSRVPPGRKELDWKR